MFVKRYLKKWIIFRNIFNFVKTISKSEPKIKIIIVKIRLIWK